MAEWLGLGLAYHPQAGGDLGVRLDLYVAGRARSHNYYLWVPHHELVQVGLCERMVARLGLYVAGFISLIPMQINIFAAIHVFSIAPPGMTRVLLWYS
jgi:hypothetical protein